MLRGASFAVLDTGSAAARAALAELLHALGAALRVAGPHADHGVNLVVAADTPLGHAALAASAAEGRVPILTEAWVRACAAAGRFVPPDARARHVFAPPAYDGALVLVDAAAVLCEAPAKRGAADGDGDAADRKSVV